jgi:peptidoglycan/LPS O-acetylase OafA/YrhL
VPAAFFAGLLALALGRGGVVRLLGGKALTYLGEISYSTYLGHYGLFILFKLAFVDASLQLGWGGLAGYLALVMAMSVALYHGLEKPAQRWLNRHPPRWAERTAVLPAE